jgi:hypothetical protein
MVNLRYAVTNPWANADKKNVTANSSKRQQIAANSSKSIIGMGYRKKSLFDFN